MDDECVGSGRNGESVKKKKKKKESPRLGEVARKSNQFVMVKFSFEPMRFKRKEVPVIMIVDAPFGRIQKASRRIRRCAMQMTRIQSPPDFVLRSLM